MVGAWLFVGAQESGAADEVAPLFFNIFRNILAICSKQLETAFGGNYFILDSRFPGRVAIRLGLGHFNFVLRKTWRFYRGHSRFS